jgi:hypothetical protein
MISMHDWKKALLLERIRDLNDAKMRAFSVGKMYYGSPQSVHDLIHCVINRYEEDELDAAERLCGEAEIEIIAQRRVFQVAHADEPLVAATLYGKPKSGKSTAAARAALHLVEGDDHG